MRRNRNRKFSALFPLALAGLLCFGMTGCMEQPKLTNQTFVMELGDDVFANPNLYLDNADKVPVSAMSIEARSPAITVKDNRFVSVSLDYLGVGEYDFVLKDGGAEYPFKIKVKDTKAPVLKSAVDTLTVPVGSDIDWQEQLGASDLSGVYYEPPAGITDAAGEKVVGIKIRDRFGNSTIKEIKVNVTP